MTVMLLMQKAVQLRTFQMVAGRPALDFVNTLDWRFRTAGPEELLTTYEDLLQFAHQSNLLDAAAVRHLSAAVKPMKANQVLKESKELREIMAALLYKIIEGQAPPPKALERLTQLFHAAQTQQKFQWNQSRVDLSWSGSESDARLPLWLLTLEGCTLLSSNDLPKVRACGNAECRWLFLDTSKNHTRRWCDMKLCGNRIKARRYHARNKTEK